MARAEIDSTDEQVAAERVRTPSVLVVLVSRDGLQWLRRCLASLARQTHARIGVIAVDNASTDGSRELLASTLGAERVIALDENVGFPAAAALALRSPSADRADYVLLLHDDTLLAPEAVGRLVDEAEQMGGAGIVGPKVLDSEEPRVLAEIGLSADRFGYPYSPLEVGEIDQGQYDRIREVLYVSSCAMLVSRSVLERVGPPDERFASRQEDLDFCWRARLAGFRVLWSPRAVALHRSATIRGERPDTRVTVGVRYHRERAALASMLKNYGVLSLVWMLPLAIAQMLVRSGFFLLTRRFEDAFQVLAAWGWNIVHLPGTLRRRVRAQSVRSVRDREIRRFMAPAWIRLGRWLRTGVDVLRPAREPGDQDIVSMGVRLRRFGAAHPVAVAWTLATLLAAMAYRHLSGDSPLAGGALPTFPSTPAGFFAELFSGIRHGGLGGTAAASPALGMFGVGSVIALGSPALLEKALILVLPAAAGVGAYRAIRAIEVERVPAVLAASCYALSAVALWGVSQGRIPELALLAGLPWMSTRLTQAFGPGVFTRPGRWLVGTALGLAALVSLVPGAILAAAVLAAAALLLRPAGGTRIRGVARLTVVALGAALLASPVMLVVIRSGGSALVERTGVRTFGALLRLSLGDAPGDWPAAYFLPLAAGLGLAMVVRPFRGAAARALLAGLGSVYLAWASVAGWLPTPLSNPVAYVAVAAFSFCVLVALGMQSAAGTARVSFGYRQVGGGLLVLVVSLGLMAQALQAARGAWAIGGPDHLAEAYPVVGASSPPAYRILWIGRRSGGVLPAPAGDPDGVVQAGSASVRFAVTAAGGASALDIGRPADGPSYDRLDAVLRQILSGSTRHGGALLAPFGIRFVVAGPRDLPFDARSRLGAQVDLVAVPAGGLTIFRDPVTIGEAVIVPDPAWVRAAAEPPGSTAAAELTEPVFQPLAGADQAYHGGPSSGPTLVLLSQQFDPRWRLTPVGGSSVAPKPAFGWAVGFTTGTSQGSTIRFTGQASRTMAMTLLLLLWLAALWITRRPSRST